MKNFFLAVSVLLSTPLSGQIVFEEVPVVPDFSLSAVWRSPTGEFFVKAYGEIAGNNSLKSSGIYSSIDGLEWSLAEVPGLYPAVEDIQFFSDGTPVAKKYFPGFVIRREDTWRSLNLPAQQPDIEAIWIRGDTLFAYGSRRFAYSTDKGLTFSTLFTGSENAIGHTAHLWVSDRYLALHHSVGATDYLSVFDRSGERVFFQEIDFYVREYLRAACDEVLMVGSDEYFSLSLANLQVTEGPLEAIYPGLDYDTPIQAQGGYYYLLDGQTLWRSPGCGWAWEAWLSDPMLDSFDHCRVTPGEGVLLYSTQGNHFVERPTGTSEWLMVPIPVHAPYIQAVDEASLGFQGAITANAFFRKRSTDTSWAEGVFPPMSDLTFQYGPDGRLYVPGDSSIYVSADNGLNFDTLLLPPMLWPHPCCYDLRILSEEVLFVWDRLDGYIYWSLDGGLSWVAGPQFFTYLGTYRTKLAGQYLIVADISINIRLLRINLATGETDEYGINTNNGYEFLDLAVMEDGSVYYLKYNYLGLGYSGLYRFQFVGNPKYIGHAEEFSSVRVWASRNVLFGFGYQSGYALDAGELFPLSYVGLPATGSRHFQVAASQHVYVIIDNTRIFRSVEPLTYAQNLSGSVVIDSDENCATDMLDQGLKGWQVVAEGGQHVLVRNTDADGEYRFNVPAGEYTITATPINPQWALCTDSHPASVAVGTQAEVPGFLAQAQSDCAALDLDFSTPLLRRCFSNTYTVRIRSTGPSDATGTRLRLELDPFFDLVSASHAFDWESDSVIVFDLGTLELNDEIVIHTLLTLSCDAAPGLTHCLTGWLTADNLCGDDQPMYSECQENIGSYDPNDKRVFNAAGREVQAIDKDEYIYYHIRFQNTGTDTAFRVRILDTLSARLDPRTLEMLSASHPYTHSILDGPILEILLEDIFLPDSNVNEVASHGYVKFRIKPYPQLDHGIVIPNEAAIYFDFNDAVRTQEARVVLGPLVHVDPVEDSIHFGVRPNPVADVLYLDMLAGDRERVDTYKIFDSLGRLAGSAPLASGQIIVSGLPPGYYRIVLMRDGRVLGTRPFARL